jgi:hypothetical protein
MPPIITKNFLPLCMYLSIGLLQANLIIQGIKPIPIMIVIYSTGISRLIKYKDVSGTATLLNPCGKYRSAKSRYFKNCLFSKSISIYSSSLRRILLLS